MTAGPRHGLGASSTGKSQPAPLRGTLTFQHQQGELLEPPNTVSKSQQASLPVHSPRLPLEDMGGRSQRRASGERGAESGGGIGPIAQS